MDFWSNEISNYSNANFDIKNNYIGFPNTDMAQIIQIATHVIK